MSQSPLNGYERIARDLLDSSLARGRAYAMLAELTGNIGPRLSGSTGAANAVQWSSALMNALGFDRVRLQPVMVPHWVRGSVAEATVTNASFGSIGLRICALGGSVPTEITGVEAEVVEVRSLDEVAKLGEEARGKIVFLNGPMDRSLPSTFDAYGKAVGQRVNGAVAAARAGAVGVLVRSMTTAIDSFPHTGTMRYEDGVQKIPAAAVSTIDADRLSQLLTTGPKRVRLTLDCRSLPDAQSDNVIGEITGSEKPEEVIVIGGHLDSWDLGTGAHDDGAGCVQAIEALRLIRALGLKPKRTIRVVLFMNEENGLRGAEGYAAEAATATASGDERHIAAIESDRGGFAPRGFNVEGEDTDVAKLRRWAGIFEAIGADHFWKGGSGADVGPLKKHGALTIGLVPESARYFDYHHAASDTFEKVNERELHLGAAAMALLAYLISEEGL